MEIAKRDLKSHYATDARENESLLVVVVGCCCRTIDDLFSLMRTNVLKNHKEKKK
jgi:hypothetical protein